MAAVRSLALGMLALGVLAASAQADAITWHWTAWQPATGVVVTNLVGPDPFVPPRTQWSPANAPGPAVSAAPADGSSAGSWSIAPNPTAASGTVDAFVNFGGGPYPAASELTTGSAQPWYNSPQVAQLFGGVPNAQQRADFTNTVIQRVEHTYQLSGIPVTLTTDPTAPAAHTLSVVSNASNASVPDAIGMTDVGGNGFNFIDKTATAAQNVDQLEWLLAHNLAHELMLAFGVKENHDQTGNFIDARNASWTMMVDPNATFSQGAAQDLLSKNFLTNNTPASGQLAQVMTGSAAVPEPSTILCWTLLAGAAAFGARRRLRRKAG
jgi:hypothetical protein